MSVKGIYPTDILNNNGYYDVSQALVTPPAHAEDTLISLDTLPETSPWIDCLAVIGKIVYYLFFPITYPIRCLCTLLLSITVFPSGLLQSEFGRWILKTFGSSDIDMERVAAAKTAIIALGGRVETVTTADNQELEMLVITQEAFWKKVEEFGGAFVSFGVDLYANTPHNYTQGTTHTLEAIRCENSEGQAALRAMGWQEVEIDEEKVFQFSLRLGVSSVDTKEPEVILRCHPHVHPYSYEKKYLINHLSMGKDVVLFDPRGSNTSEEGVYLDADAVYNRVKELGYAGKNIYITSRCSGTPYATYLRHRYADDGANIVLENPFERFPQFIARLVWPINYMELSVLDSMASTDEATIAAAGPIQTYVDHFDNVRKLQAMPKEALRNRVIVLSTDTDTSIGSEAAEKIASVAARTSVVFHLKHRGSDPLKDGHFEDLFLTDPALFAAYSRLINNGTQYLSNFQS